MAIDAYRKDLESKATPPKPEKAPGTRFADVMKDKENEDSAFFATWLKTSGGDAGLAQRFASENMVAGDQEKLSKGFDRFGERKEKITQIVSGMTPDQMKIFAKRSPLLTSAVELGGPERLASVFKDHLTRLAFEEPAEFADIEAAHDALQSFKSGDYKAFDEDVVKRSKELGITEGKYVEIMQMPDEGERVRAFRAEVRSSFGWFGKPKDWGFKVKELAIKGQKDELDRLVKDLDNHEYQLGSALGVLADRNETVRKAVNQELLGIREKPKKLMTFAGSREATKKFEKGFDFEKEKKGFYDKRKADLDTSKGRKAVERDFAQFIGEKFKESAKGAGGGKWLDIILAIFGMKAKATAYTP